MNIVETDAKTEKHDKGYGEIVPALWLVGNRKERSRYRAGLGGVMLELMKKERYREAADSFLWSLSKDQIMLASLGLFGDTIGDSETLTGLVDARGRTIMMAASKGNLSSREVQNELSALDYFAGQTATDGVVWINRQGYMASPDFEQIQTDRFLCTDTYPVDEGNKALVVMAGALGCDLQTYYNPVKQPSAYNRPILRLPMPDIVIIGREQDGIFVPIIESPSNTEHVDDSFVWPLRKE